MSSLFLLALLGIAALGGAFSASTMAQGPVPTVGAGIQGDWINLHGWTPESTVALNIGGAERTAQVDGSGSAFVGRQTHSQDVVAGMTITATDGTTTKTLVVADVRITGIDLDTNVVSGFAPANRDVHVFVHSPGPPLASGQTTAAGDGTWSVNLSPFDLQSQHGIGANVGDEDGDFTGADRFPPTLGAGIQGDYISLSNWTPGGTVELSIGGVGRQAVVDGNGNLFYQRSQHGQDLVIGMTITATDGISTKTLEVANVQITTASVTTNVVSGIAPPLATVTLNVNQGLGPPLTTRQITAAEDGTWTVDLSPLDLDFNMGLSATVSDTDADRTTADRFLPRPAVAAGIQSDTLSLNGWTPNSTVSLNIGGVIRDVPVDGNGNAFVSRQVHGQDIVAGMTITAGDGTTTKSLLVVDLQITIVDVGANVVSGVAPPNATFTLNVNQGPVPPLTTRQVTAGGDGTWTVDLSPFDLQLGMGVSAFLFEPDGDRTIADRFLPLPTIQAGLTGDFVNLNQWTPNSTVTVTIDGNSQTVTTGAFGQASLTPGIDLVPGMLITATDGTTTKSLTTAAISVDTVDPDTDDVSGTAPPGSSVFVSLFADGNQLGSRNAVANAGGAWTADFSGTVNFDFGTQASASVNDADFDSTLAARFATPPPIPKPPGAIAIGTTNPDSLDPGVSYTVQGWDVINQMFVGLTRWDLRAQTLELDLATGYDVSADLRTWTFTLRPARWSDGQELTADDVVFGIERAQNPATGGNARPLLDPIETVTALGPHTVRIELSEPLAYLPALLSTPTARPVPQHVIEQHGSQWLQPDKIAVSGAYTLTSRSAAGIVLERNPDYYGTASIETVVYDTTAQSAFSQRYEQGELDFVSAGLIAPNLATIRNDPRLGPDLVVGIAPGTQPLLFNTAHGATADVDVRRALSAATDRARIARDAIGDESLAARTFTAPSVFGAVPESAGIGITFDPDAALAYKAAAGAAFPSSITIRFGGGPRGTRVAAILKEDWERIFSPGFTVNLQQTSGLQIINEIDNPDPSAQAPVSMLGWIGDWPDASNFLGNAIDVLARRWSHAGYDALVEQAATTLDEGARRAAYADAERILTETEAPIAPLHYIADAFVRRADLVVVGDRVENWRLGAEAQVEAVASELEALVAANPDSPVGDKVEDAFVGLETATAELEKTPPDGEAAAGNIEGAIGDLEAAHKDGQLDATALMNHLAGIARQLAVTALDGARERSGDEGKIADAERSLAEGDAFRAEGRFKDAAAKYKDALAKADSA